MTHAQHDVCIQRPIEDVFEFIADGRNNPQWQRFVVSTTPPDGAIGVGSMFTQRGRHPFGFTVSADYRITAYDPPHALSIDGTSGGPIRPTLTFELVDEGSRGTLVRCSVAYRPSGLARLARPALSLLHPLFAWEASAIERLRPLLETEVHRAA